MKRLICLAALLACNAAPAAACNLIESYTARLGAADHFNSNGVRLTSAAAIIRQDRANFYEFGRADPEDESDSYFASKQNRATLERMLRNGQSSRSALAEIVNGTPLIEVRICESNRGEYVNVTIK